MASRRPDRSFWNGKRVLLTGHTGFKGAWAGAWLDAMGAEVHGLALPPETEPSLHAMIGRDEPAAVVDLRDRQAVRERVRSVRPQIVLHMGAQAIVRTSIAAPVETLATNVMGTAHLLDALRDAPELACALTVTSDKVYANDDGGRSFRETDPLGGKDPYSASKAAAEIVVASFARTYFRNVAVATARGGNVVGGGDYSRDRLVPDIVRAASAGTAVALRHPESTRPWQHVLDCVAGYLCFVESLVADASLPREMNFGPREGAEMTVAAVAEQAMAAMGGDGRGWRHVPVQGSVEAKLLAVDASRAERLLGFACLLDKAAAVDWTMEWYAGLAAGKDARALTLSQIARYEART